jgi:tripartite-type tricarboxylate transporter receptor subunit TctC
MLTRRAFATQSAALIAAAARPARAVAQGKYPTKAVEVVVPFAPGGGTDNLMRTIVGIIDENKWCRSTSTTGPAAAAPSATRTS